MNILILDAYYPRFLESATPLVTVGSPDYVTMRDRLLDLRFGTSDFYSRNLTTLGHRAQDIVFNCEPLQQQWIAEHRRTPVSRGWLSGAFGKLPFFRKGPSVEAFDPLQVALEQIRAVKPEILYMQDLNLLPPETLRALKTEGSVGLVVGQIACPLPEPEYLSAFDLILTSFPHYVERFRRLGVASEYFRIAFDPIVLDEIGTVSKTHECTFVGGISPAHSERLTFLERLAREVDIEFYGYGANLLQAGSPIAPRHRGEVWGLEMYRALARSRITVNIHIDVAENYANNMRLYEATGSGTLLLTDMKDNLSDLFKIDEEVVTYRSPGEAIEKIRYYSENPAKSREISLAGQRRTLSDHTYLNRMHELTAILEDYLSHKKRT